MKNSKLSIINLRVAVEGKEILKGISLAINSGEVHAIMGPNGSGKSTLAQALMGHPALDVRSEKLEVGKNDLRKLKPNQRAKEGLFLAFQNPIAIPGVSVANFLKTAHQSLHELKTKNQKLKTNLANPALSVWEFNEKLVAIAKSLSIPQEFLRRSVNDGFSGGEKKKIEMLQALVLAPKFAIFDEIDTGLDIDALKIVAAGIIQLKKNGCGILIITHYQRILNYIKPDYIHILISGKIIKSGGGKIAAELEKKGYASYTSH